MIHDHDQEEPSNIAASLPGSTSIVTSIRLDVNESSDFPETVAVVQALRDELKKSKLLVDSLRKDHETAAIQSAEATGRAIEALDREHARQLVAIANDRGRRKAVSEAAVEKRLWERRMAEASIEAKVLSYLPRNMHDFLFLTEQSYPAHLLPLGPKEGCASSDKAVKRRRSYASCNQHGVGKNCPGRS